MSNPSQETGAIKGQVADRDGRPLAWAAVMITGDSPPHPDIACLTDDDGGYAFDNLLPGNYTIMVNAEGFPTSTGQTPVAAGEVARLDFSLSA